MIEKPSIREWAWLALLRNLGLLVWLPFVAISRRVAISDPIFWSLTAAFAVFSLIVFVCVNIYLNDLYVAGVRRDALKTDQLATLVARISDAHAASKDERLKLAYDDAIKLAQTIGVSTQALQALR